MQLMLQWYILIEAMFYHISNSKEGIKMIITRPDYFKDFRCVANNCVDNCCEKWGIVIDEDTLKRYKKVKGEIGKKLKKSIDYKNNMFYEEDGRCSFLDNENLCEIQKALGHNYLCKTCRRYPRHVEEFENVREWSLSISCSEVAKIILARKDRVRFVNKTKNISEETFQEFDNLLYDKLILAREYLFDLIYDESKNLNIKMCTMLAFGHDIQRRINNNNIFDIDSQIEIFKKNKEAKRFEKKLEAYKMEKSLVYMNQIFDSLYDLEVLNFDWRDFLDRVRESLYELSYDEYRAVSDEFFKDESSFSYEYNQLLTYFIFTYFCGSVYDGECYDKVKMAVTSTILIREMYKAVWKMNGGKLNFEERVNIVYLFSRELEHSDDNLKLFEKLCEESSCYKLSPLLFAISYQ